MNENLVRVAVDDDLCIGIGQCEMLEEDTFLIDDDTAVSVVIRSGMLPLNRAEKVIDSCPGGAISIVPDGGEG